MNWRKSWIGRNSRCWLLVPEWMLIMLLSNKMYHTKINSLIASLGQWKLWPVFWISSKLFLTSSPRMRTGIHSTCCCNHFKAGLPVPVGSIDYSWSGWIQNFCRPFHRGPRCAENGSPIRGLRARERKSHWVEFCKCSYTVCRRFLHTE